MTTAINPKARAVAHYAALAAEAEALAASRNTGSAQHPTVDDCHAFNAISERTARRAEAAVWLILALAIGCPLAWWLAEWAACGSNRMGCA